MKRLLLVIVFCLFSLIILSLPVFAQSPGQPSFDEALRWIVGPGAAVLAGLLISVVAEYWAGFQALDAKYKVLVYFGLCLLATFGGTALAVATGAWGAWGDVRETWWPALWQGISASGVGTLFHAWVPSPLRKNAEDGG
jgi:hypothetical protein